jgi:hypothetical protein
MKKSTLDTVLARKRGPGPAPAPLQAAKRKVDDGKMTTSLRIDLAKLEALKIIALRKRVRVNDLVLQGIDHVIALNKELAA